MKRSDAISPAPRPASFAASPLARSLLANVPVPLILVAIVLLGNFVITPRAIGAYNMEIVMQIGIAIILATSLQLINGFGGQFSLGHAGFMAVGAYLSGYPSVAHSRDLTDPAAVLLFYVGLFLSVGIAAAVLVGVFKAARASARLHPSLPAIVMVVLLVWILFDISRSAKYDTPPAYLFVSRGVALLRQLFDVIVHEGGSRAAAISAALPQGWAQPVCFIILLIGGGLCAAGAGLIVGLPTLRLRGDYLAIATLGFAEIIRIAIQNAEPLGESFGLSGIPGYTSFAWLYGAAFITIIVIWRLAYSDKGRAIQAVREDEVAAAAMGIDTTHHKVLSFVIGSFFAGVGGVLYAHFTSFITPEPQVFGLVRSIEFVVMVTLGGLASISGAVLAAIALTLLPELLRNVDDLLPDAVRRTGFSISESRMVIYSLLLIGMMLLRPQGLLGGKELWPRRGMFGRRRLTSPIADPPEPETAAL